MQTQGASWTARLSWNLAGIPLAILSTLVLFESALVNSALANSPEADSSSSKNPLAESRPNIIVIYTDDQGCGDVSCLNPKAKFQTPNLDQLAAEGIIFSDAHCSDTVCTPSRYGLLTGRYCWRTELKRSVLGAERACLIEDGRMTLASLCRQNGYATAMVGKWHLGMDFPGDRQSRDWSKPVVDMPLDKGFDYFFGIPASLNYGILAWFEGRYAKVPPVMYTQKKKNAIAIDDYRIKPPYDPVAKVLGGTNQWGIVQGQLEIASDFVDSQCLTRFTDQAIDWVERHRRGAGAEKPFFLYLPYTSPHKPVIPIDRFRGKSDAGAYGDFMMETDWQIGRLLESLDRLRIRDQTMVVFSSDNGPENTWKKRAEQFNHQSNLIYREGKRSIYEGGHRVPFFIRWPQRIQGGSISSLAVCQTDLLATLAELFGTTLPDDAGEDSVSFLDEFANLTETSSAAERLPMVHHSISGGFAIRAGRWKLIMEHRKQPMELYDLTNDPSEEKDVINMHPDLVQSLTSQLTKIVQDGRSTPGAVQSNDRIWWDDLTWITPPVENE